MRSGAAPVVPRRRGRRLIGVVGFVALVVAACGADDDPTERVSGPPAVLATTSIWADIVGNVACGGLAEVSALIPAGRDPHGFEPSLADRGRLEEAALVVANGLGLEEGLEGTLDAAEGAGATVLRAAEQVSTLPMGSGTAHHDDDHEGGGDDHGDDTENHEHGADDPHVWFDPTLVAEATVAVGDALVSAVGLDAAAVAECVEEYRALLLDADREIAALLTAVPEDRRRLVTNHDSLGYFAARYGFEVIGTVIPGTSGLAETNPARLEELAQLIEAEGTPAIFADAQASTEDIDALARRLDAVEVVVLPTGTLLPDGEPSTYLELLRTNAEAIADALR